MAAQISTGAKVCCQCGKNLSGQQRMKDSEGKYWCIPCGEADRQKKRLTAIGNICSGCGENFSERELTALKGGAYCKKCLKKAYSSGGGRYSSSMGGGNDRAKKIRAVIFLGAIVAFGVWYNTKPKVYDEPSKPAAETKADAKTKTKAEKPGQHRPK